MMLERALTLKRPILLYTANHDIPILSSYEWNLVEKLLHILQPFYEITKQVSSEMSCLSDVIPHVIALERYLLKPGNDSGIQTTKKSFQNALKKRLLSQDNLNILEEKNYVLSTALDPRYKLKYMKEERKTVEKWLLESLQSTQPTKDLTKDTDSEEEEILQPVESNEGGLPVGSGLLKETIHNNFMACYDDEDDVIKATKSTAAASKATVTDELKLYFNSHTIPRSHDPIAFWKENRRTYPGISELARRYLSCPASSVYSERLFSEAGNIFDQHRARLLPKNGEKLLFLHHNLRKVSQT